MHDVLEQKATEAGVSKNEYIKRLLEKEEENDSKEEILYEINTIQTAIHLIKQEIEDLKKR